MTNRQIEFIMSVGMLALWTTLVLNHMTRGLLFEPLLVIEIPLIILTLITWRRI